MKNLMSVEEIAAILAGAVEDIQTNPLKEGERRRTQVKNWLEGKLQTNPYPYRTAWLNETANQVVDTMGDACEAFNKKYPEDRATAADLIDVLLTSLNKIVKAAGMPGIHVDDNKITILKNK